MKQRKPNPWISRRLLSLILDDFSFFGSIPFYLFVTLIAYFTNHNLLFSRLGYSFLIGFLAIIAIKKVHYKDRPQKEEFTIFMEKVVASSFPSSHSATVTLLGILLSISFPTIWVISSAIIISLLVYLQRYITKKHFFIDIVGGAILAVIISIFVIKVF